MTRLRSTFVSLVGLVLAAPLAAQSSPEGSWIVTGWSVDGQAAASPQRGLMIFTKTNYSIMFIQGNEPRASLGDSPTAEARAAAYDAFTANGGRLTIDGDKITLKAYVAKNPDYMALWTSECITGACPNDAVVTFKIEGDTMTLTWPARNRRPERVATLRRVG